MRELCATVYKESSVCALASTCVHLTQMLLSHTIMLDAAHIPCLFLLMDVVLDHHANKFVDSKAVTLSKLARKTPRQSNGFS